MIITMFVLAALEGGAGITFLLRGEWAPGFGWLAAGVNLLAFATTAGRR